MTPIPAPSKSRKHVSSARTAVIASMYRWSGDGTRALGARSGDSCVMRRPPVARNASAIHDREYPVTVPTSTTSLRRPPRSGRLEVRAVHWNEAPGLRQLESRSIRPAWRATSTLEALQATLRSHPVYSSVRTVEDVRFFMERHVLCVWDFMPLLKSLQRELTCVDVPWRPAGDTEAARLVNEIVLAEESDVLVVDRTPRTASHFEWYLDAMGEVGGDTRPVRSLLRGIASGAAVQAALERSGLPDESIAFSRTTFELLERPLHVRAAVFLHGREDVIQADVPAARPGLGAPRAPLPPVRGVPGEARLARWRGPWSTVARAPGPALRA